MAALAGAAERRFQPGPSRQQNVGVCDGSQMRYNAIRGVGESGGAALGRFQPVASRQQSVVGVCDGSQMRYNVLCVVGESGAWALSISPTQRGRLRRQPNEIQRLLRRGRRSGAWALSISPTQRGRLRRQPNEVFYRYFKVFYRSKSNSFTPANPAQPSPPSPASHRGGEWFLMLLFGVFKGVSGGFRIFF